MLAGFHVARVAADPGGEPPGGWNGLIYHRLHGSPEIYHSDYAPDRLPAIERMVVADAAKCAGLVYFRQYRAGGGNSQRLHDLGETLFGNWKGIAIKRLTRNSVRAINDRPWGTFRQASRLK